MADHPVLSGRPHAVSRRHFLKAASRAAGTAALGSVFPQVLTRAASPDGSRPNLLFILVDQWRFNQHLSPPEWAFMEARVPNYGWLAERSVRFRGHYGAAAACTPARSTILTGLYTHQTAILNTFADNGCKYNANTLNPGFLTWGHGLRQLGYQTAWWGKWHESPAGAKHLAAAGLPADLERYGFDGGTFPPYLGSDGRPLTSAGGPQNGQPDFRPPIGFLNQGIELDGFIAGQFEQWLDGFDPQRGPFATAVSLIDPHDIAEYPFGTLQDGLTAQDHFVQEKPPNYEGLATLEANKPRLQQARYYTDQLSGGPDQGWRDYLDYYYWLHARVDEQVGAVLRALGRRPNVAANTIIIFTADHGDHGGSHGLHEKALTVYEESIRLPLLVYDPTGRWSRFAGSALPQLTSTVDLFALLLTLASGGLSWQTDARFQHLRARVDWSALLTRRHAPGREYVVSTSDEFFGDEFDPRGTVAKGNAPFHVIGVRTNAAKFATYNFWTVGSLDLNLEEPQETELYDYSNLQGRLELDNSAARQPMLTAAFQEFIRNSVLPSELRQPLPPPYQAVHEEAVWACLNGIQIPASA